MGEAMAAAGMIPPPAAPEFLSATGWPQARIEPLAGDASFRRYFRIRGADGRTAVLMDAPPQHEDVVPFLRIGAHLRSIGLSAPNVLAADLEAGLLLLEDFGDARLGPLLVRTPAREQPLYDRAIEILAHLHSVQPPDGVTAYTVAEYKREADLFLDWWVPAAGLEVDRPGWDAAWKEALGLLETEPHSVLVVRDYHADNLMVLDDRPRLCALGLLDFQDALTGHPAYDLVSLLQDARRDVSASVEARCFEAFALATGADPVRLQAAYELLGAQRNLKILGIFTRLWKRDGKPAYLGLLPRVWRHVERNLRHPATAPIAQWMRANVPAEARHVVLAQAA